MSNFVAPGTTAPRVFATGASSSTAAPDSIADPPLPVVTTNTADRSAVRTRTRTPRLSVLIVNYRQWEETADLIRQLQATEPFQTGEAEVVVVDNHSPNHPVIKKLRRIPGVSLRRWDRNQGFAKAVNEGCRLSRGDWFLLLNPDTTLSEEFIEGALRLADELSESEPKTGIVGFHLRNSDGTRQYSAGPFPTLVSTFARLFLPRARRKYIVPREPNRCDVPWVTGCCLMVRRDCLEALGGLDEDFFLYYEDVDLCLRARNAGWAVAYEPRLAVIHHHPLHLRKVPPVLRMITRHSLLTYARKHWGPLKFRLLAQVVAWETLFRLGWAWWQGDAQQLQQFREMRAVCKELARGENAAARLRIHQAIRKLDVRVGV